MLIQSAHRRTEHADGRLALVLPAAAGALNAAAFKAFGLFSANMTGNGSQLSIGLAQGAFREAAFLAAVLASYVAGASTASFLVTWENCVAC